MSATKYARDFSGSSIAMAHWKWGSRRELAVAASPQRSTTALDGHLVFVETSTAVHFRLGDADVTADSSDPVLKPGAVYAFPRAKGEDYLSAVTAAEAKEGMLQFWEADSFEEA
ncbi:MAG: hypothetical protein ACLFTG_01610 [Alphaproteobacteria bacterium]